MDADPQLLYLEPDDEITSVIRRLRGADAGRVVLVAPGRSRATSSVVALRLLARAAADSGRSVALVADASTRALAGEAGVAAFASVADATSPTPSPPEPITPTRAPIHVVRGAGAARSQPARPSILATDGMEETVAVHLPPPTRGASGRGRPRRPRLPRWPWLVLPLVLAVAVGMAILPAATVRITPASVPVTPQNFVAATDIQGRLTQEFHATKPGTATGQRLEQVPATGEVTFFNRSIGSVEIPEGTQVSVGGTIAFVTVKKIQVPGGQFFGDPGEKSVGVVAVQGGPTGNVAAGAIDTIDDPNLRFNRLVTNRDPTTGGVETPHPVIQQSDVDAVLAAIDADLRQQLSDAMGGGDDRIYADAPDAEVPVIEIPQELIGTEETPTFELSGTLAVDRAYGSRSDVEQTARSAMVNLGGPPGRDTIVLVDSITVVMHDVAEVDGTLEVQVSATALAALAVNEAQIRNRIKGKTIAEAKLELSELSDVQMDLWPGWVDKVPVLDFRIEIIEEVRDSGGGSPQESVN
ncbi:MAG: baseplate J/gp47 family protein [Chloroflexota bacterium]